jgi:hypothetical protein
MNGDADRTNSNVPPIVNNTAAEPLRIVVGRGFAEGGKMRRKTVDIKDVEKLGPEGSQESLEAPKRRLDFTEAGPKSRIPSTQRCYKSVTQAKGCGKTSLLI